MGIISIILFCLSKIRYNGTVRGALTMYITMATTFAWGCYGNILTYQLFARGFASVKYRDTVRGALN